MVGSSGVVQNKSTSQPLQSIMGMVIADYRFKCNFITIAHDIMTKYELIQTFI